MLENHITDGLEAAIKQAKPLVEKTWYLKDYKPLLESLEKANDQLRQSLRAIRNLLVVHLMDGSGESDLFNMPEGEQKLYKLFKEILDLEDEDDDE